MAMAVAVVSRYDIAIINDTLAYGVGEIWQGGTRYNTAKWNGSDWTLKLITVNFRNSDISPPLEGIFTFSITDIWVVGSLPIHGNGQYWSIFDLRSMSGFENISLSRVWGKDSSSIYFVGGGGSIVHYTSGPTRTGTWTKIESGTSTNINDIFGVKNIKTEQYEAYCAVTDFFQPKDKKILRIAEGRKVDSITWGTGRDVVSVWSANGSFLYVCGDGVFENSTGVWKEIKFGVYTNHVRGSAANNVFVVGDFGLIAHFNGGTWKKFYLDQNASYISIAVTKD